MAKRLSNPFTLFGVFVNFCCSESEILCAGSVEISRTFSLTRDSKTAILQLHTDKSTCRPITFSQLSVFDHHRNLTFLVILQFISPAVPARCFPHPSFATYEYPPKRRLMDNVTNTRFKILRVLRNHGLRHLSLTSCLARVR